MNLRLIGGITIFVLLFGLSSSILVHSAFAEEVAKKKKEIDLKKERELKKAAKQKKTSKY